MTAIPPPAAEPDGAPRIASLDILRGIAILGILFMNINDMGASLWASYGDVRHIGWTRLDQIVWWLRAVLADGTARGLLEMLFGAGMVILTDRMASRADEAAVLRGYIRRNLVLLVFGLVHLFVLLWPGDILHTYALAALIVVFARGLTPRLMLVLGLSMALVQLVNGGVAYVQASTEQTAVRTVEAKVQARRPLTAADRRILADASRQRQAAATAAMAERARVAREDRARRGDARSWAGSAWSTTIAMGAAAFELDFVWEAAATMLIGAAFYRWGIIQGSRSWRFYAVAMVAGYGAGLPLRALAAGQTMRFDGGAEIDWAIYEIARLATTLGHLGLIHLLLGTMLGARLLRPFAAAGRTALSIYVLQTLVCLWLLYPPFALGMYGRQGWAGLMTTALVIDAGLLLIAVWWVRRFTIAPVEWAWRSLAEGRRLPFGRVARPGAGTLPA